MERMGDARRIDHLRALALSSMPSLARRPSQKRNSGTINIVEQRKTLVSAFPVKVADDKEEGELSSDDETDRTATPLAAVESSFSFTHRNTGLSLRAPIQEKDERHTSAATSAESVPLVGGSSASVFSTSTRVSIVNKSQLFSAFTAQAPPLISSPLPGPVHNGSGVGIGVRQYKHALPEVNSSSASLDKFLRNPYHGASENSLQASSTVASQLIPTPPNVSRSHASENARSCETIAQSSSIGGSPGLQIHIPARSSILASLRLPDPPAALSVVTRAVPAVPVSATAIAGADVSIALGTLPTVSLFATPVIVGAGRNEAGVRKEAEAFLASLRIPLANSTASGDENENAFVIKFDEDSESDGENENRTNPSRRHQARSSRKGTTTSAGPMSTSVPVQSNQVMPTQSPADLTAEIDRMKKQIAAMERTKGKTSISSVLGQGNRVLPTDTQRNVLTPATEPRPSTHFAATNVRTASVDLESMRLRIAAKESELQQRRQRLAVKVPESGRGGNDPKRTGGVLASSLSPTRSSQAADSATAHAGNSIGKSSSEKGISGYRKEVKARADCIPALALAGPAGANLASFKKDAEQRGLDGSKDHRHPNGLVSNFAAAQVGSHVGRISHPPASKGMKRSRAEEEGLELAKAPRWDKNSASEKILAEDSLKEAALPCNASDALKGGRSFLPLVQTAKRKVDASETSSDKVVPGFPADGVAAAGPEAVKKLKTNSGGGRINSSPCGGEELSLNSNQYAAQVIPPHDVILSTILPREKLKSTFPSSNTSLKTGSTPDMVDGNVGIRDEQPAVALSAPLPVVAERQRSSGILTSSNSIQQFDTAGNAEALRIQRASRGPVISLVSPPNFGDTALTAGLTQSAAKTREFEQTATCTTVAVTECQQVMLGRLNPNSRFTAENSRAQTTQPWKLVNPVSSENLGFQAEDSFHPGHSSIDNQHLGGEHVTFQQLLEEEGLLDKHLEEVQRIRQQCEVRERIARREYREAQWALRAANADCHTLNQRKESLLSRIHAAEARHLSGKSSIDRPLVPFGGTIVTHKPNMPEQPALLVSAPSSLPVSQALEGSWEKDVSVDRGRSPLVRETLDSFSSDRVDLAAVPHRDAKLVLSAEVGEQNSRYKLAEDVSSDGKEQESHGQLIKGVESSGGLENGGAVGEKEVHAVSVNVGSPVDGASQAENQCYVRSESNLNNDRSFKCPSADFDNGAPGVSSLSAEIQHNAVSRTYASDTTADELLHETSLEESEQVPPKSSSWITIECSKQTTGLCSVNGISIGVPRMEGLSAVGQEDDRHPVPAQQQVPRLDSPQVTGKDLEQGGSDKEYHDVKQITASNSSQDAQSIDSLRSAADLVQDLDTTDVHESVSVEDVNGTVDDTMQDALTGNVSPGIHEHDAVPIHFKECIVGAPGVELAETDCHVEAEIPDVFADSMSKECAGQVLPEISSAVQQTMFLEKATKAVVSNTISRGYAKDAPLDPEGESLLCSVSRNTLEASGAREGIERSNVESSLEAPDDSVRLMTEPQQCPSHLPPLAMDTVDEEETFPNDGDIVHIKISDAPLSDVEREGPVMFGNSSSQEAPPHSDELKAQTVDESNDQGVSATLLHPDTTTDDPTVPDLDMRHARAVESPGVPGEHLGLIDVECQDGTNGEENSSAAKPGSYFFSLQEELDRGVLREHCVGGAESTDFIVHNFLTDLSPTIMNHVGRNPLITQNQYCQPPSDGRDPPYDSSFVAELADSRNLNRTGLQGCADSLEEQHLDAFDVPPQPDLKMSFDYNSTTEGFEYRKEGPVQDGDGDLCKAIDSEMITDNSEVLSRNEFGSQEGNPAIAVIAEDQQQDQLNADMSESGEQKREDSEKKVSKGADVEVFRKALLDGNIFERRSISVEAADTTNLRKQNRNEVSKQLLSQLQQHRLEHLLDMVEVRVPELSSGGDILIQEGLQGEKEAGSPVAVDDLQMDTPTVESHDMVGSSGEQALSPGTTSENVSDIAKHWVPSADSLVVHRFIPIVQTSQADIGYEMGRMASERVSKVSFGTCVVLPHRYESPLSIFRSYRNCTRFSGNLQLSSSSITWSHAINPFKPLCKFEHRGKCNNDDCPWQHADDYTFSSSQVASQAQNYVHPKGLTCDDQDVAAPCLDKDRELAMAGVSLPTGDSLSTATLSKAWLAGPGKTLPKSSMWPVSSPLSWNDSGVPIYRTGSYTLRAEDPKRMCLLSHNLQLDREVDSSHSSVLSPSIHRPLPSDIPCLLDASENSSWFGEDPAYHPGSPHWRYVRDIQEKLMGSKDGVDLQELIDEEMWLELALHHIDYDLSTDNNKARDQALFYLSRALESKQSSVILWVVYSCLFHMRKDNPEKDDMFHHAVQYNPGSYELWVLYINSRSDFKSRLEAYEKAITALADKGAHPHLDKEELSACILDIGLQMLYFWCISGCSEDSFLWVDDLIYEASAQDYVRPHRGSTRVLLSHLTQHDSCVIWIACAYLLACKHLPNSIITRLGCKQELPDGLEWEKHAKLDELSHKRVMKALSTAASDGLGCLSLGSAQASQDKDNFSRQFLGVNYIQCLALYESLDCAASFGKKLMSLHPTSLDLVVVCARIDEHRKGFTTGLRVFEEALLHWPHDLPGMQRLWNQYAGHALLWGGKDLAKTVLFKCAATKTLLSITEVEVSQPIPTKAPFSLVSLDQTERSDGEGNTVEGWSHLREYFLMLTSVCKRSEGGTISSHQLSQVEDTVFALINLALVEALSGDITASQSAINSAMKAAISHRDLRHCWRELAAQQVCSAKSAGWGDPKLLEHGILSLLDRCKTDSYNLSQLRPLSEKAFQNHKKPHVRKFLEDLIGPSPSDHSVLNSILRTLYGPQMLPSGSYPLKEVFDFAEGILEAIPGNVLLASSLCKIVGQSRGSLKRMYMPAVMWASALLRSALYQSCPVAPEVYWVEAGSLLRQLHEERSLEEFYKLALVKYPFSAALHHCLQEVEDRLQVPDTLSPAVYRKSPNLVVAEPMQVAVEC